MLLLEESDRYTEFSEEEKGEFLFRLFKHLQLGGRVNQVSSSKLMHDDFIMYIKNWSCPNLSLSHLTI